MNRADYFSYIERKLNMLASRISSRGRLNILDLHTHSENFYRDLLNNLYGWSLANENVNNPNVESIDLIDKTNKFVIQVSATNTKQKIEKSLSKDSIKQYQKQGYTFKFISIANDADNLRTNTFKNPYGISFNFEIDIIDKNSIFKTIKDLKIEPLTTIYEFIKKELGSEPDIVKLESNLSAIINILSKENLDNQANAIEINSFEIERKIDFNQLTNAKEIISDWKTYMGMVDRIYTEFDTLGYNKSSSVLNAIKQEYIQAKSNNFSGDKLFLAVIDKVVDRVKNSSNNTVETNEELEQCVDILVVDAFIRCKIFDNPQNYNYATTG
ncbi:hypothetical protein AGMMS4957_05810 [Bacteroidia bacterium]|nr:hypothetical protein AGMMS4957_05810 [Bacteroidia bacterium]